MEERWEKTRVIVDFSMCQEARDLVACGKGLVLKTRFRVTPTYANRKGPAKLAQGYREMEGSKIFFSCLLRLYSGNTLKVFEWVSLTNLALFNVGLKA